MGNMSCRHREGKSFSVPSRWKAHRHTSDIYRYLEDFCLTWVGVCVLFSSGLGVMLVLPLGPHLTGTTLELSSALTAFPGHIWRHIILLLFILLELISLKMYKRSKWMKTYQTLYCGLSVLSRCCCWGRKWLGMTGDYRILDQSGSCGRNQYQMGWTGL